MQEAGDHQYRCNFSIAEDEGVEEEKENVVPYFSNLEGTGVDFKRRC